MKNDQIKVWDYLDDYKRDRKQLLAIIDKVFLSGQLILGENVNNFENEFSSWCGVKYGVGVGNGTDALFICLKALNIEKGDEIITVSNTAVPTVSAIVAAGATPVFADISLKSYLIQEGAIEKLITKKTKAVLVVHLYGQMVNIEKISEICKQNNLRLIEDCAQSHGAEFNNKKSGSFGDISAFSFYPTKILGTFGDAGMCLTNSYELYERLKSLRFYGMKKSYYSISNGYNSRLDELHAAILRFKLKNLDNEILLRRKIAHTYNLGLSGTDLILPEEEKNKKHAYYLYVVRHNLRDKIMAELAKIDVNLNVSYPFPIHSMPAFRDNCIFNSLKNTNYAAKRIFSLPMYPGLNGETVNYVINSLKKVIKKC